MTADPPATAQERLRLFVAVEVPDDVRAALHDALAPLRRAAPEARWVPPERWHLTLAFLGHVPAQRRPEVEAALAAAARRADRFALALAGALGRFGGRVLFASLEQSDPLLRLAGAVRAELAALALPSDDRPFRAHLTVARAPGHGRLPRRLGAGAPVPRSRWAVDEVTLVRSELGRGGARHTTLGRWGLGGS